MDKRSYPSQQLRLYRLRQGLGHQRPSMQYRE